MNCRHCYSRRLRRHPVQFDLPEAIRLLDDLADFGVCSLVFGYGEPFLYENMLPLLQHADKRSFIVTVMTNGGTLTSSMAKQLAQLPTVSVSVSMDSATSQTHDNNRRILGAWGRAYRTLELLRTEGVHTKIASLIDPWQPESCMPMLKLASELGVEGISFLTIRRRTTQLLHTYVDSYLTVVQELLRAMESSTLYISLHDPLILAHADVAALGEDIRSNVIAQNVCTAATGRAAILPDRSVHPCMFVDWSLGSCGVTPFSQLWSDTKQVRQEIHNRQMCGQCARALTCSSQCLANCHGTHNVN